MPRMLFIATSLVTLALATGCGSSDCETVCAKNVECQKEAPAEAACVATCEELSAKKESYADALSEQASCYEDATCEEIAINQCIPEP
jgi:hypothetical protein